MSSSDVNDFSSFFFYFSLGLSRAEDATGVRGYISALSSVRNSPKTVVNNTRGLFP